MMFWAVISFICSVNGCIPLPQIDFKPEGTHDHCQQMRDALVKPDNPVGDRWLEAYCTRIGGTFP